MDQIAFLNNFHFGAGQNALTLQNKLLEKNVRVSQTYEYEERARNAANQFVDFYLIVFQKSFFQGNRLSNEVLNAIAFNSHYKKIFLITFGDLPDNYPQHFLERTLRLDYGGASNYFDISQAADWIVDAIVNIKQEELNNEEKKREIKANIENEAPLFIQTALNRLKVKGKELESTADRYFIAGYMAIILGIIIGVYFFTNDRKYFGGHDNWSVTIFFAIKSVVIIGLVVAVAKYAFSLGNAYMHESLKVEDRIHAISFGEFYLKVFKEGVAPADLKEVFRDWNINNQATGFSKQDPNSFDPKYLENVAKIIGQVKDAVKS